MLALIGLKKWKNLILPIFQPLYTIKSFLTKWRSNINLES